MWPKKKQSETMWGERNWATTQDNETYKVVQKIRKSNHKSNEKKKVANHRVEKAMWTRK